MKIGTKIILTQKGRCERDWRPMRSTAHRIYNAAYFKNAHGRCKRKRRLLGPYALMAITHRKNAYLF